ncbi:MAG: hypothetical protein EP298_05420 [Gammaproteobacteria bacterium]|nr:MAG: hypothetical protein EP298_05420 [Gammaproteobacteria bacterium]UTW43236.1 hypothetical protein KFE69_03580 [bacterium SCSIO 12844]
MKDQQRIVLFSLVSTIKKLFVIGLVFIFLNLLCSNLWSLTLKSQWGNKDNSHHLIDGVFVVWWNNSKDRSVEAKTILSELNKVRDDVMNHFGMIDPPNITNGNYINIYLHQGQGDTVFPVGNGVGTDQWGNPYMTIGSADINNLDHEAFHLYQYNGVVRYRGDTGWYIESSANWYAAIRNKDYATRFIGASSLVHHPQLPMWHSSFFNREEGEKYNWGRAMHQYEMSTFLYYLTKFCHVSEEVIGGAFYKRTGFLPQKYLYEAIGKDKFREYWLNFTAQLAGDYGFLTPDEARRSEEGWYRHMEGQNDDQRYVKIMTNSGTEGQYIRPDWEHMPKGWSYNAFKIINSQNATYTVSLEADKKGTNQTISNFNGKVVIFNHSKKKYYNFKMLDLHHGEVRFDVNKNDNEIYIIVASMPESFSSNERYPYQIKIDRSIKSNFEHTLDCIKASYVYQNVCTWSKWTEMYKQCKTYQYPSLDDGFFATKVKKGLCNIENWYNLMIKLKFRQNPPNSLESSLLCVKHYADQNQCTWAHWSEMYSICQTYDYKELDTDNFLLNQVIDHKCTRDNWPKLIEDIFNH